MNHDRLQPSIDNGEKVEGKPWTLDIKEKSTDDFFRIGHFEAEYQALDFLVKGVILLSPKPRYFMLRYNDYVHLLGEVRYKRGEFGEVQVEIG